MYHVTFYFARKLGAAWWPEPHQRLRSVTLGQQSLFHRYGAELLPHVERATSDFLSWTPAAVVVQVVWRRREVLVVLWHDFPVVWPGNKETLLPLRCGTAPASATEKCNSNWRTQVCRVGKVNWTAVNCTLLLGRQPRSHALPSLLREKSWLGQVTWHPHSGC